MTDFSVIKHLLYFTWTKDADCSISWWIILYLFLGFYAWSQRFTRLAFTESLHRYWLSFTARLFIRVVTSDMFSSLLSLSYFSHTLRGLRATTSWAEGEPNLQEAFMACDIYVGVSPGFPTTDCEFMLESIWGSSIMIIPSWDALNNICFAHFVREHHTVDPLKCLYNAAPLVYGFHQK